MSQRPHGGAEFDEAQPDTRALSRWNRPARGTDFGRPTAEAGQRADGMCHVLGHASGARARRPTDTAIGEPVYILVCAA